MKRKGEAVLNGASEQTKLNAQYKLMVAIRETIKNLGYGPTVAICTNELNSQAIINRIKSKQLKGE